MERSIVTIEVDEQDKADIVISRKVLAQLLGGDPYETIEQLEAQNVNLLNEMDDLGDTIDKLNSKVQRLERDIANLKKEKQTTTEGDK